MVRREALTDIKEAVKIIIDDIVSQIQDGRIESEPSITDRFVQKLQDFQFYKNYYQGWRFDRINCQLVIQIRTLGDRGKTSSESKYGADMCLIMDIIDGEKKRKKGILIQAKMNKSPIKVKSKKNTYIQVNVKTQKFKTLNEQLQKMSRITPENYILIYDESGFFIINANHLINPEEDKENINIRAEKFEDFFNLMIKCQRGDRELTDWQDDYLEELINRQIAYYFIQIKYLQTSE